MHDYDDSHLIYIADILTRFESEHIKRLVVAAHLAANPVHLYNSDIPGRICGVLSCAASSCHPVVLASLVIGGWNRQHVVNLLRHFGARAIVKAITGGAVSLGEAERTSLTQYGACGGRIMTQGRWVTIETPIDVDRGYESSEEDSDSDDVSTGSPASSSWRSGDSELEG